MKLSTTQKVYVVVLALALATFGVDRVFFRSGQSEPQSAAGSPTVAASGAAILASLPAPAGDGPGTASVSAKLRAVSDRRGLDPSSVREAFLPPPAWRDVPKAGGPPKPPEPTRSELFARRHALSSVALVAEGGTAIIDGQVVQVGESVDGFRLVSVAADHVILRADDDEVRLQLSVGQ